MWQDNAPSLAARAKKSDAREIQSFYQQYYENYVRALDQGEQADRCISISPTPIICSCLFLTETLVYIRSWSLQFFVVFYFYFNVFYLYFSGTGPNLERRIRLPKYSLKFFVLLIRLRKSKKLPLRFAFWLLPLLNTIVVILEKVSWVRLFLFGIDSNVSNFWTFNVFLTWNHFSLLETIRLRAIFILRACLWRTIFRGTCWFLELFHFLWNNLRFHFLRLQFPLFGAAKHFLCWYAFLLSSAFVGAKEDDFSSYWVWICFFAKIVEWKMMERRKLIWLWNHFHFARKMCVFRPIKWTVQNHCPLHGLIWGWIVWRVLCTPNISIIIVIIVLQHHYSWPNMRWRT